MRIVIASGKGGVGKSMIASSLALLFSKDRRIVACDCDVDTPNLALWLGVTEYDKKESVSTSKKAEVISQKGLDEDILKICRFRAIEKRGSRYEINQLLCEGCGVCRLLYPQAIDIKPVENGEIRIKITAYGFPLVSAQLYPGESGSGKIVEELKRKAEEFEHEVMVLDAAAGIGCPVIASLRGSDFALLVTEPTPSGVSDLKRILEIVIHFRIPFGVVVNKWDINPSFSKKIEARFKKRFLGKISYDRKVVECIVNLKPVMFSDSKVVREIEQVYEKMSFLTGVL